MTERSIGGETYKTEHDQGKEIAVNGEGVMLRMKSDRRRTGRVVTDNDVARRAYALYLARGGEHGHDLDDWLRGEQEMRSVKADLGSASNSS